MAAGATTLATYSNLNKATGYSQKHLQPGRHRPETVTLKSTGVEDVSWRTSFVIDDTAVTVS
jgi:hypothetical protein